MSGIEWRLNLLYNWRPPSKLSFDSASKIFYCIICHDQTVLNNGWTELEIYIYDLIIKKCPSVRPSMWWWWNNGDTHIHRILFLTIYSNGLFLFCFLQTRKLLTKLLWYVFVWFEKLMGYQICTRPSLQTFNVTLRWLRSACGRWSFPLPFQKRANLVHFNHTQSIYSIVTIQRYGRSSFGSFNHICGSFGGFVVVRKLHFPRRACSTITPACHFWLSENATELQLWSRQPHNLVYSHDVIDGLLEIHIDHWFKYAKM